MKTVHLKFFASLREALGDRETIATACNTVGELRDELISRGGAHAEVLARGKLVRAAVDQTMAEETAHLSDGAEVAFFPPVTGG
jgi:molybdopterin synthase sulfur carrier subunit